MTQTMATTPTTLPQTTAPSSQTARSSRSSRAPLPSTASTEYNYIGLYVVSNGGARFTRATTRNTVARCDPPFINRRNVSCELSDLDPCEGGYTMMACTYNPEMEGSFYLKVFSDQPLQDLEPVVPVPAVSAVSAVSGGNEGTEMEEMEETEETEEKTTTGGQVGGRESGSGDGDGGLGSGGSGGGSGSGGQKQKAAKKAAKKAGKSLRRLTSRDPVV